MCKSMINDNWVEGNPTNLYSNFTKAIVYFKISFPFIGIMSSENRIEAHLLLF